MANDALYFLSYPQPIVIASIPKQQRKVALMLMSTCSQSRFIMVIDCFMLLLHQSPNAMNVLLSY